MDNYGGFYVNHENEHDRLAKCLEEGEKYGVRVIISETASILGRGSIVDRIQKKLGVALPWEERNLWICLIVQSRLMDREQMTYLKEEDIWSKEDRLNCFKLLHIGKKALTHNL